MQLSAPILSEDELCPLKKTTGSAVAYVFQRKWKRETTTDVGRHRGRATWLILPVVICLSQRLSHACASMNQFEL